MSPVLIDLVLTQIAQDVGQRDFTAIEELLLQVPQRYLEGYLPEGLYFPERG